MKKNWYSIAIKGARWADEGNGKVADYYGSKAVLFSDGKAGNAGHTDAPYGQILKLHLTPA